MVSSIGPLAFFFLTTRRSHRYMECMAVSKQYLGSIGQRSRACKQARSGSAESSERRSERRIECRHVRLSSSSRPQPIDVPICISMILPLPPLETVLNIKAQSSKAEDLAFMKRLVYVLEIPLVALVHAKLQ